MGTIIGASVLGIAAIACFVTAVFQFREKGFLLNNAYLYASQKERETMDKKPHYRQSGICFTLVGVIVLLNAAELILKTGWLFYAVVGVAIAAVVYAVVSSVVIEKKAHL